MFPLEISGWALFVHDLSLHPHIHTISINFMQQKKKIFAIEDIESFSI